MSESNLAELRGRLATTDPGLRRVAVLEVEELGDERLLPDVVAVLQRDPEVTLRAEAARVLGGWGGTEVVVALAEALRDQPLVRDAAAGSLTELKDAEAAIRLVPYARDADPFICASALRGLKELRIPAAAQPALAALTHADAAVRREAVGVLGWLKQVSALQQLAHVVAADPDPEVRRAATGALGFAAPDSANVALPALRTALTDRAWAVREEAATTLGKFTPAAADVCSALRQAMDDEFWQVRLRAARSLGRLKDREALPLLIAALIHPAGNLRKEAAIALGDIGDVAAVEALRAVAADPDPEVRKAARLGLQRLPVKAAGTA